VPRVKGKISRTCATVNGDEKAQKHPHCRHHRFGSADPFVPRPLENEGPQSLNLIALGLLAKRLEQSDKCQTVAVQPPEGFLHRASACCSSSWKALTGGSIMEHKCRA
jgi:hypothetical protein